MKWFLRPLIGPPSRHETWVWRITWRVPILAPFVIGWYAVWLMFPALLAFVPFIVMLEGTTGSDSTWFAIIGFTLIGPIWFRAVAWFFPAYFAMARLWLTGRSPYIQKKLAEAKLHEGS